MSSTIARTLFLVVAYIAVHNMAVMAVPAAEATGKPTVHNSTIAPLSVGGFVQTCPSWAPAFSSTSATLFGVCINLQGQTVTSSLNLDPCFANTNGIIHCQTNGNFLSSGACTLTTPFPTQGGTNAILQMNCRNNNNVMTPTSIDLNACVGNVNGVLQC